MVATGRPDMAYFGFTNKLLKGVSEVEPVLELDGVLVEVVK